MKLAILALTGLATAGVTLVTAGAAEASTVTEAGRYAAGLFGRY